LFPTDQYQLLDFGDGRKLERFGANVLDRPSPAAERTSPADRSLWSAADARYVRTDGEQGRWEGPNVPQQAWTFAHGPVVLELKLTDFGHLGAFPEQAANWDWLTRRLAAHRGDGPPRVLNLFAYTGGSTLAAATAGAQIVHVDSARGTVEWARRNAALSGLSAAPVRWIVEDAARFVRRERKRGNRYEAVILDPPSYGHGPKGQPWKLSEGLAPLLADCAAVLVDDPLLVLMTCHSPGFGPAELSAHLSDAVFGSCGAGVFSESLWLATPEGRRLHSGEVARWPV